VETDLQTKILERKGSCQVVLKLGLQAGACREIKRGVNRFGDEMPYTGMGKGDQAERSHYRSLHTAMEEGPDGRGRES